MSWFGTGLTLREFLALPFKEKRARFYELSDVDQLLFVERCQDWLSVLLSGINFPAEDQLPETEPFGVMKAQGIDPARYGYRDFEKPSAEITKLPTRRAGENGWIH